jgi:hypothetical protein
MLAGAVAVAVTWGPIDFLVWAVAVAFVGLWIVLRVPQFLWRLRPDTDAPLIRGLLSFWGRTSLGWGFIRAAMAGFIGAITMVLGFGLAMFGDTLRIPAFTGVGIALFLVAILVALLFNAIILWNRPKFLVPPGLRGQPGLFGARRALRDLKRRHPDGVDGSGPIDTDDDLS